MKRAKLITFDATGTLFTTKRPIGDIYYSLAEEFSKLKGWGPKLPEPQALTQSFSKQYKSLDAKYPNFGTGVITPKLWWRKTVYHTFIDAQPLLQHSKEFDDTFSLFFEDLFTKFAGSHFWEVYPETVPVLKELKRKGIKLGVISNFDDRLPSVLKSLDLDRYFEPHIILSSYQAGHPKPHPQMFRAALSAAGIEDPSEAIHIGDCPKRDLAGAQGAGMRAFLVDRSSDRKFVAAGIPSENVVYNLREFANQVV